MLTIKPVNIHQVNLLQKISKETFLLAFADDNTQENLAIYFEKTFSIAALTHQIHQSNSKFYFVYHDDLLAAYFKINIGESQTEIGAQDGIELERLYVYPTFQNKKIGNFIINEVKIKAVLDDKKYIWLGVWEHNINAIRFYQNQGFKKFDSHIYPIGKDLQTDWMMRLEL
ncbi:GNAT family N-acetyltransferase [Pedobacter sp. SD-b]|uniref:GNAT family N-acetyltransferase n=1 Tax=Pedobacter segetis TaxID=2793069 RepID=A0ABS1BGD1_9SPHI|nr:GNAT family N-acetyltransferase [Pedobacter segetis]MBK0381922.1 GNAT family N-acetyltransferase [Pedobacter segetis]